MFVGFPTTAATPALKGLPSENAPIVSWKCLLCQMLTALLSEQSMRKCIQSFSTNVLKTYICPLNPSPLVVLESGIALSVFH